MDKSGYLTTDLYLAAYLRARGCRLSDTSGFPKVTFRLEAEVDIPSLVTEYFNDRSVPIQTYLQNLKALRSICFGNPGRRGKDED